MSFHPCARCNRHIRDGASCPFCQKTLTAIALVSSVTMGLAACNEAKPPTQSADDVGSSNVVLPSAVPTATAAPTASAVPTTTASAAPTVTPSATASSAPTTKPTTTVAVPTNRPAMRYGIMRPDSTKPIPPG